MRSIRYEDVELPEFLDRALDGLVAERSIRQIALDEQTPLFVRFDFALGLQCVRTFRRQIVDGHVRAFAREQHGDCTADPGIATRDERDLVDQFARGAILLGLIAR